MIKMGISMWHSPSNFMIFILSVFGASAAVDGWQEQWSASIDSSTKSSWCSRQQNTCTIVCYTQDKPTPSQNECSADTLTEKCICGDTVEPKLDLFKDTISYFKCTEVVSRCQQDCGGKSDDQTCKVACLNRYTCATQSPTAAARVPLNGAKTVNDFSSSTGLSTSLSLLYVLVNQ